MERYTPTRIFNKYFILIWFVTFGVQMGQNIYNSVISVYAVSLGYSNTFAGSLAIPYMVLAVLGRLVAGYISDKKTRRLAMAIGCSGFAIGSFFYHIPGLTIPIVLLFFRGIMGFGYAAGNTAYAVAVVDVIPKKDMSMGLGINWAAQGCAQLLCGVLITAMVVGSNYIPIFVVATVFCVLGIFFSLACNYEKGVVKTTARKKITVSDFIEKKALLHALVVLLYFFGLAVGTFYTLTLAEERGIEGGGLFFTLRAVGMVVANLTLVKVADRYGRVKTLIPTFGIGVLCMIILALADSFIMLMIAGLCYGISIGVMPILQNALVDRLPEHKRGAGTSTLFLAMDISMGVGPIIWGALIDAMGVASAFYGAAIAMALALVVMIPIYSKTKR